MPEPNAPRVRGDFERAVVHALRQPLVVLDADLRVVSANPAFLERFDAAEADVLERPFRELELGEPHASELLGALRRVLEDGAPVEDVELRRDDAEAGARVFVLGARRIESDAGRETLVLVSFEDVTEQRRAERALRRYTERLERSNRDLEEFAHAASHDLQEPLRKVRTFGDRLVQSLAEGALDERQRGYVERMQDAAARMQARIDDLLGLARVSRQQPQREMVDLAAVVETVLRDLERPLTEARGRVDVESLPAIEADRAHMELLFQNLLSNALKYRKPERPPRVRVAASPAPAPPLDDRPWVRLTVSDNGIGFDPQYAERIFRPFERLHGRAEYEGSGVGLSVCRRVAELHGGTVTATARPDAGATFEILLPAVHREDEP